jgi:hypothetical protein
MHLGMILSNEPTLDSLLKRPLAVSNATLHEFILHKLKQVTLSFSKTLKKTAKLEEELNDLVNSNDPDSADKIRNLEEVLNLKEMEHLERELQIKENFTLLEDEKPTTNFLNLESTKGGYNEITTLRELNTNYDPNKEESNDNIKYNVFNNQPLIRDKVTDNFQEFYKKQPPLTTRDDLLRFLKKDDDTGPMDAFNSRKLFPEMKTSMEINQS